MKTLEELLEDIEEFQYHEIEDLFEDMLDEIYPSIDLAGMTICASDMKTIDPIMFRCGVSEWSCEEFEEYAGSYYRKDEFEEVQNEFDEQEEE